VKLLVDNNLPVKLASGLAAFFDSEHEIVHIRTKFGTGNLPDEEWIKILGGEGGWAVLTADMNIARKKPSRDLFVSVGLVGVE
jgi:predicted nuclease of predicted toxin-antitoxin system